MSGRVRERVRAYVDALNSGVRLVQFAAAGFLGTTVDLLVLFTLVEFTFLGPVPAKAISWETAVIVIFVTNECWTFGAYGQTGVRARLRRFGRSNLVRLGGFAVTLLVFTALVYGVDVTVWAFGYDVWYLVANAIGIGVGFFVNYSLESLYTWRVQHTLR